MPHDLAQFFCLAPQPGWVAQGLGCVDVEGLPVEAGETLYPCVRCLPMGWSWAMWFVQELHEQVLVKATGLGGDLLVREGHPAP